MAFGTGRDVNPALRLDMLGVSDGVLMSIAFNGSHHMSVNLSPQAANIDRTRRWRALGQHGATVWLTGLPGAGKTTIANELEGLAFIEVFVNTPAEECARRDPKGLYARARSGTLRGLTGVDAPYERPRAPEIELTPALDVNAATGVLLAALDDRLRRAA